MYPKDVFIIQNTASIIPNSIAHIFSIKTKGFGIKIKNGKIFISFFVHHKIEHTMKSINTILVLLTLSYGQSLAQKPTDTLNIPKRAIAYAADKFTVIRPLNIEFTHAAPYNFSSVRQGSPLPDGRVNSFSQAKLSANVNFIKKKNWLLGATIGYRYTNSEAIITNPFNGYATTLDEDFHYHFTSMNFSYFSSLFAKRMIYSASAQIDGSERYFERFKGLASAVMVLKANQRTKMTVGILANIDPSAQTPFIPIFTYEHKFSNGLVADITLPRSLYLRKQLFGNGRLSLGTELDRTTFYLYRLDGTEQKYEYRQLDLLSGLNYEHAIGNFVLTAKSGMKLTPSGRLFRKEDSFKDAVFEMKPDPAFYFNIGISFNPFTLLKKRS